MLSFWSTACQRPLTRLLAHLPSTTFTAWIVTSSAALTTMARAPTPPRASPSCARGLRAAPSPRSRAPPHRSARFPYVCIRPRSACSIRLLSHRLCLYAPPLTRALPALTASAVAGFAKMTRRPSERRSRACQLATNLLPTTSTVAISKNLLISSVV